MTVKRACLLGGGSLAESVFRDASFDVYFTFADFYDRYAELGAKENGRNFIVLREKSVDKALQELLAALKVLRVDRLMMIGYIPQNLRLVAGKHDEEAVKSVLNLLESYGVSVESYIDYFAAKGKVWGKFAQRLGAKNYHDTLLSKALDLNGITGYQASIWLNERLLFSEGAGGTDWLLAESLEFIEKGVRGREVSEGMDLKFDLVFFKLPRPNQNLLIDVPVVGKKTFEGIFKMKESLEKLTDGNSRVSVVMWEGVVLDLDEKYFEILEKMSEEVEFFAASVDLGS